MSRPIPQHEYGIVFVEFDATPSVGGLDGVFGVSNGKATRFTDLAAIVRFNNEGNLDARDGDTYRFGVFMGYSGGITYHVTMRIDLSAHTYTAFVATPAQWEQRNPGYEIAYNYHFRTEQASLTRIDTVASIVDSPSGQLTTCDFSVTPDICDLAAPGWVGRPFPTQTGRFQVQYDATPSSTSGAAVDAVTGIARLNPKGFKDLAAIVRFNQSGMIDVRDGGTYRASQAYPYTSNATYRFILDVDQTNKVYSVWVRPLEGSGNPATYIATNYAFRTEQSSVISLGWQGAYLDSPGEVRTCNLTAWNYDRQ